MFAEFHPLNETERGQVAQHRAMVREIDSASTLGARVYGSDARCHLPRRAQMIAELNRVRGHRETLSVQVRRWGRATAKASDSMAAAELSPDWARHASAWVRCRRHLAPVLDAYVETRTIERRLAATVAELTAAANKES